MDARISNAILLSARAIREDLELLSKYKTRKINIIFNNFQSSTQLNNLSNSSEYISNAIVTTSLVIDYFKESEINKIIYTSSSSVYGNNILCSEEDEVKPLNLHSSLKIANEKLIEKFCTDQKIDFTITRIFNMYGADDKFSVISKILSAVKNTKEITIVNGGNAIRDFIHIDDVVEIYTKLLQTKVKVLNVGTGNGVSIKSLLDFLHYRGVDLKVKNIERDELKVSTADIKLLKDRVGKNSFKKLEDYLLAELNI
ncbi:MAG: SDR family oxidoreductase [Sulfurimonas sp.]|nr:SDR family oxidoreductase [Sulfurimonas sp.]